MTQLKRIDFDKNIIAVRYTDDQDPEWAEERLLVVNWTKSSHLRRLIHVACHVFLLLIQNPEFVETHDEILEEWLSQLFNNDLAEEHEVPWRISRRHGISMNLREVFRKSKEQLAKLRIGNIAVRNPGIFCVIVTVSLSETLPVCPLPVFS